MTFSHEMGHQFFKNSLDLLPLGKQLIIRVCINTDMEPELYAKLIALCTKNLSCLQKNLKNSTGNPLYQSLRCLLGWLFGHFFNHSIEISIGCSLGQSLGQHLVGHSPVLSLTWSVTESLTWFLTRFSIGYSVTHLLSHSVSYLVSWLVTQSVCY